MSRASSVGTKEGRVTPHLTLTYLHGISPRLFGWSASQVTQTIPCSPSPLSSCTRSDHNLLSSACFVEEIVSDTDGASPTFWAKAYPNLYVDVSKRWSVNTEQDTPAEIQTRLDVSLEACLRTLAQSNLFGNGEGANGGVVFSKDACRHPFYLSLHPPVYTCEQAMQFCPPLPAETVFTKGKVAEMKNLFLKDKKKNFFLISAVVDTEIRLRELKLEGRVKGGGVSFASAQDLWDKLGLVPGSVTPFGLMNDRENMAVTYFLDPAALNHEYICFHPNACHATLAIHTDTLPTMLEQLTGHEVHLL